MPRNECADILIVSHQGPRSCPRPDSATIAFVSSMAVPKNCRTNPSRALSYLLLELIQPLPHADELRHLRLVVFLSEPPVSLMVHPLGPLREGLRHVSASSETLPNRLGPAKSTVHLVLPLALVDEVVAMTAQEVASQTVKESYPPTA